jgi:hypothetical protein
MKTVEKVTAAKTPRAERRHQGYCDSNEFYVEWLLNRSSPIFDWM